MLADKIERYKKELVKMEMELECKQWYLDNFVKVGDVVYLVDGWNEYFPQEILAINVERAEVEVIGHSINKRLIIDDFFIINGGECILLSDAAKKFFN